MNNRSLKSILYTVIVILIIFFAIKFLVRALPFIIVGIFVLWLIFKFKKKIVKDDEPQTYEKESYNSQAYSNKGNDASDEEEDDFDTSNAIDVDFEDVDEN